MKNILQKLRERKQRLRKEKAAIESKYPKSYDRFNVCVERIIGHETNEESGKTQNVDQGGLTIYGISHNAHPKDVNLMQGLTRKEQREYAIKIYKKDYWNANNCDDLPIPLDFAVFNTAINSGSSVAQGFLEQTTGDWREFLLLMMERYITLKDQPRHAGSFIGWMNRHKGVYKQCREDNKIYI